MPPTRPCKQLNSARIKNSLRANLLNLVSNNAQAVCCRAIWSVEENHLELAKKQIALKRLCLDDVLANLDGVHFLLSAITAIQRSTSANSHDISPGVAYFIVSLKQCSKEKIFAALHRQETQAQVKEIQTKGRNKNMEAASHELFQVVKDHKNETVCDLVRTSNAFCFANSYSELAKRPCDDVEQPTNPRYYPTTPCRLLVVNHRSYDVAIQDAFNELADDGLNIELGPSPPLRLERPAVTAAGSFTSTIMRIEKLMTACDHALHRGNVYCKPTQATYSYCYMMSVDTYVNKLLVNDAVRENILKHMNSIITILSHDACEMIQQLRFDYDVIEVDKGLFFQLSARRFTRHIPGGVQRDYKWSPRAYMPYDPTTEYPDTAHYFSEGILNSFPDNATRIRFLNKFYQCLFPFIMPQKTRKLVVVGPKDSGKTSWANVFHRLIARTNIASITKEAQFSAAMICDHTELIVIDEWCGNTMSTDVCKTILQGGWMVTAVKHRNPRCLVNNSPFYITCNQIPDFRDDQENIERRIDIFQTKSLPQTVGGADKWIYDHAMHCIAWIAREIQDNLGTVEESERWYETAVVQPMAVEARGTMANLDIKRMRSISDHDLTMIDQQNTNNPEEPGHMSLAFRREAVRQIHLMQRPQNAQGLLESSDEQATPSASDNDALHEDIPSAALNTCRSEEKDEANEISSFADRNNQLVAEEDRPTPDGVVGAESPFLTCPSEMYSRDFDSLAADEINTTRYHARVFHILKDSFGKELYGTKNLLTAPHLHSFLARRRSSHMRERTFWTKADAVIDAWCIVISELRDVFNFDLFYQRYHRVEQVVRQIRNRLNMRVLQPYDIFTIVKKKQDEFGPHDVEEQARQQQQTHLQEEEGEGEQQQGEEEERTQGEQQVHEEGERQGDEQREEQGEQQVDEEGERQGDEQREEQGEEAAAGPALRNKENVEEKGEHHHQQETEEETARPSFWNTVRNWRMW